MGVTDAFVFRSFWSNFEIADLRFWRSQAYQDVRYCSCWTSAQAYSRVHSSSTTSTAQEVYVGACPAHTLWLNHMSHSSSTSAGAMLLSTRSASPVAAPPAAPLTPPSSAAALFAPADQIHQFNDIAYRHNPCTSRLLQRPAAISLTPPIRHALPHEPRPVRLWQVQLQPQGVVRPGWIQLHAVSPSCFHSGVEQR